MQEQVHVRIDEPRHQRAASEIDQLGSARPRHGRAGGRNALTLDEHFAGSHEAAGVDFEQMRCVQHDGMDRAGRRRFGCARGSEAHYREQRTGRRVLHIHPAPRSASAVSPCVTY